MSNDNPSHITCAPLVLNDKTRIELATLRRQLIRASRMSIAAAASIESALQTQDEHIANTE